MITYQTIPGIIQTSIAGEYLLVVAKEVRGHDYYVAEINESSAFLWQHLKTGCTLEKLLTAVQLEYDVDDAHEIQAAVESFVKEMLEMGFIRKVEDL